MLVASTYPLEIVQADRWVKANTSLKGDALTAAVAKQNWEEGVKSLAAVPSVLGVMADKLDWMISLGDAVLAQEPDVMDAIQRLRSRAHANNKLSSRAEQTVTVRQEQNKQIIAIEPTVPDTIHVPHYDSGVVYAGWPYADYPPYSFAAPGYVSVGLLTTGVAFGTRYALGRWTSGGNRWGGGFNWGNNNIARNRPIEINKVGETWQHRPEHRHGVRYN